MILGHHRDQLLFERHQRLEVREKRRPKHDDEIDLVGGERRHRPLVIDHFDVESTQRMGLAKFADLARQEIECERLAAGDAHRAAAQAFQVLDLRFHALDFAVLAAQVMDEDLARRGEPHAARPPIEQRRAEFILEIGDPAVHGRGGDIEPLGSLADRARPARPRRHSSKCADVSWPCRGIVSDAFSAPF